MDNCFSSVQYWQG